MPKRQNDNKYYAWYMDQKTVNFIEKLTKENKVSKHRIGFGYGSCRVPPGVEYELIHDSDGYITAVREIGTGETYM